jgi:hypothetical protein
MRSAARPWGLFVLVLASAGRLLGDEPKIIPAAEARQHLNEECVVELTVRSSKHAVPRRVTYLDSEADFKDPENLAILISDEVLPKFREADIEDPSAYYKGKTIRVTGKITLFLELNAVRVHVTDPKQVEVVDPENAENAPAASASP